MKFHRNQLLNNQCLPKKKKKEAGSNLELDTDLQLHCFPEGEWRANGKGSGHSSLLEKLVLVSFGKLVRETKELLMCFIETKPLLPHTVFSHLQPKNPSRC